jgi:hypothetical protein
VPCANAPPVNLSRIEAPAKTNSTPPQTAELLEQLRSIDWFQFENLIGCVYRKLGYNVNIAPHHEEGGIHFATGEWRLAKRRFRLRRDACLKSRSQFSNLKGDNGVARLLGSSRQTACQERLRTYMADA